MNLEQGLLISKLILVGHRKNYQINFHPGVNIIYGDSDTGKSSILRLIYYLLGGKEIKLDEEISSSVKYAVLELRINGSFYCISRDIYNPSRDVEVYSCNYSEISNSFPDKYKSGLTNEGERKSLSEFLFEALGLPMVQLKQAPTKDSSKVSRLSFLDLFKFIYLAQDDVGSTHMLNIGNHVLEVKNREVFKYIFNVLDSAVSEVEGAIASQAQESKQLAEQYAVISHFLAQTDFKDIQELDNEINDIDKIKSDVQNQVLNLNQRMISNSEQYESLKGALSKIILDIKKKEENKTNILRNIERFERLFNDYKNDIEKIESSLLAKEIIGEGVPDKTNCPVCESIVQVDDVRERFDIPNDIHLKNELTSIKRRSRDLKQLIIENKSDLDSINYILSNLYTEENNARRMIDEELASAVSPYLAERDAAIRELAQLDIRKERLVHSLRVRNKQSDIANKIEHLERMIEKLKVQLNELKENAPSLEGVLKDLGMDVNNFIQKINIKNPTGIGIDEKTFFPKVRGVEYRKINSGGLRTIVSIGYLASILSQRLRKETNLPALLMIDTVGKYLGKTLEDTGNAKESNLNEVDDFSDPEKYRNLFNTLVSIAERFEESGKLCQIILVDNDIPFDITDENKGFEVAHYRSSGVDGLPVGLIDDWDNVSKNID